MVCDIDGRVMVCDIDGRVMVYGQIDGIWDIESDGM